MAFFTKRLIDDVDQKADKSDVDRVVGQVGQKADQCDLDELKRDIKGFLERQDRQHESNTERLDKIIMELGNRDRTRRDRAEDRRS